MWLVIEQELKSSDVGTWQHGFPPLFGRKWFTMRWAHHTRVATGLEHAGGGGNSHPPHSAAFCGLNCGLGVLSLGLTGTVYGWPTITSLKYTIHTFVDLVFVPR